MKVGLDIRPLLKEATGVGIYWKNLLSALAGMDESNEYYLFSCSWKNRFKIEDLPRFERKIFKDIRFPQRWLNLFWAKYKRPRLDWFFHSGLDIAHSPSPMICPTRGKTIITVHDLYFADHPGAADREASTLFLPYLERTLSRVDAIVAVSAYVKRTLLEQFFLPQQKISVIHHGVDLDFFHPKISENDRRVWDKYKLTPGYIFYIGTGEPRKNIPGLLEAFSLAGRNIPDPALVIAGKPGGDTPVIQRKIRQNGLFPRVKLLPYVPRKDVPSLYRGAGLFVFPSFCEGFGLPLLEAMACHVPVAASEAAAIPEIAGKAALYFNPSDSDEMAHMIQQGLQNKTVREKLISAGRDRCREFTWADAARQTQELHLETAEQT